MKAFWKKITCRTSLLAVATGLALAASGEARAATGITPGDLLELRYATGHATTPVTLWLDEVNPMTKTLVQTIDTGLTFVAGKVAGDSGFLGGLNLSSDGLYVTFAGFDSTAANTKINRLSLATGAIDNLVTMSFSSGGEFGTALVKDGTIYVTNDKTGTFTVNSVGVGTVGTNTSLTQVMTNGTNLIKGLSIVDNQLYAGVKLSGSTSGVLEVDNKAQYLYSGKSGGVSGFMKVVTPDGKTTYVYASDNGAGKFSLQSGNYKILNTGSEYRPDTGSGYSYLTGKVNGGTATLYVSKGGGGSTTGSDFIYEWDDTIANTSGPTAAYSIWQAPTDTIGGTTTGCKIAGLAYVPTPIPPAFFLLGSGLSGMFFLRRRKTAA